MFEYYIWAVCFVTLYISIFWISLTQYENKVVNKLTKLPYVSIIVPAYNEEKNINNALNSLINLDYPKEKIEIIVVDDCSTDKTVDIVKDYAKRFKYIKLLMHDKNMGNAAHSLNTALKHAKGELFARLDADSVVSPDSLMKVVHYFSDQKVGAVVSPILPIKTGTIVEKIQRFEYILTNFIRNIMAKIYVLHYTTGVLTTYRTDVIKRLGYFDEDNITEDLEIALRLIKNNYTIEFEPNNITYTYVPATLKKFWDQRIRWYRGFLHNSWKYKDMFFNKKYGLLGTFQTPLNILFLFVLLFSFALFVYQFFDLVYNFFTWLTVTKLDFLNTIQIPDLEYLVLSINIKVVFPIIVTLLLSVYIYKKAHNMTNQKWKVSFITLIYLFIYPFITTLQWVYAIILELFKVRRKW